MTVSYYYEILEGRSHVSVSDAQHVAQCEEEPCDHGQVSLPLLASDVSDVEENDTS